MTVAEVNYVPRLYWAISMGTRIKLWFLACFNLPRGNFYRFFLDSLISVLKQVCSFIPLQDSSYIWTTFGHFCLRMCRGEREKCIGTSMENKLHVLISWSDLSEICVILWNVLWKLVRKNKWLRKVLRYLQKSSENAHHFLLNCRSLIQNYLNSQHNSTWCGAEIIN